MIITHDGPFHADEVLACAILRFLPEYLNAPILRSRNSADWAKGIAVGVGGVYDPDQKGYDHHQSSFSETFSGKFSTRLSSAGLIFKHFGIRAIKHIVFSISPAKVGLVHEKVYENLIEAFDAIENRQDQHPNSIEPCYTDFTGMSYFVESLNPSVFEADDVMMRFHEAISVMSRFFRRTVQFYALEWLSGLQKLKITDSPIMILDKFFPWKVALLDVSSAKHILFVIYPGPKGWRVESVPVKLGSYESRKNMPEPWHGKTESELSAITGIPGCTFCHANGFIGGNLTISGALRMAKAAVDFK